MLPYSNSDGKYESVNSYIVGVDLQFEKVKSFLLSILAHKRIIFKITDLSLKNANLMVYFKDESNEMIDSIHLPAIFSKINEFQLNELKSLIPFELLYIDLIIYATQGIVREEWTFREWKNTFKNKKHNILN